MTAKRKPPPELSRWKKGWITRRQNAELEPALVDAVVGANGMSVFVRIEPRQNASSR